MIVEDSVRDGWITERTLNDTKDYFQSKMTLEATNQLIEARYFISHLFRQYRLHIEAV